MNSRTKLLSSGYCRIKRSIHILHCFLKRLMNPLLQSNHLLLVSFIICSTRLSLLLKSLSNLLSVTVCLVNVIGCLLVLLFLYLERRLQLKDLRNYGGKILMSIFLLLQSLIKFILLLKVSLLLLESRALLLHVFIFSFSSIPIIGMVTYI